MTGDQKVSLRRGPMVIHVRGLHSVVIMGVAMILVTVFNVFYTQSVDRQSQERREQVERAADQRWCRLLTTLDTAYNTSTPASELGRQVAKAIHDLRTELRC